jgi:hypothetical protein
MGFIEMGADAGAAAGSWVEIEGNDQAVRILVGIEDCDPEVMDMMPAPLSGEWAGESLTELGLDGATEQELADYEIGFSDAYWATVAKSAQSQLG